jgi:leucyl aminopeptidase
MIDVAAWDGPAENWKGDALLLLLDEDDCKKGEGKGGKKDSLPCASYVRALVERGDFDGKKGSLARAPLFDGPIRNLYLAGLGKKGKSGDAGRSDALRDALTSALRKIGREHSKSALVWMDGGAEEGVILGEAAELCGYSFDKYKKKEDFSLAAIAVAGLDEKALKHAEKGRIFARSQCFARGLANEPGNAVDPPVLADIAARLAKERGLECEVWDEKRLAAEKMGALLAVGQGSAAPPRFIHLTYSPKGSAREKRKKIAFVGKGITFDSGGLDLKPFESMKTMKGDKSGACNVLAVLAGAAELGLDAEVHGFIAAAENMPSGSAFRPDDIVRARNGKTIEISSTDAEGRLVLADALTVASELKPDAVVDMATLTGACAVALGNWTSGIFTPDDALFEALAAASRRRGERLWRLPMDDEKIGEELKSKFADLINAGGRYGGAIFAAMFLAEFVGPGIAWAHLDIAGSDFIKEESGVYARGASAWGVRTCLDYLENAV